LRALKFGIRAYASIEPRLENETKQEEHIAPSTAIFPRVSQGLKTMQTILYGLFVCYLFVMPLLFANWFGMFQQDTEAAGIERKLCWIVLALATVAWPIVLPLTYVELLAKVKRYERRERLGLLGFESLSEGLY
jgi:ABC-type phosphate transport system permease subunit